MTALPGVERASISATVPCGMVSASKKVQRAGIQSSPMLREESRSWLMARVGADTQHGRTSLMPAAFHRSRSGKPRSGVAIIDEVLAEKPWPDWDALAQRNLRVTLREAIHAEATSSPAKAWK